ncbi:hypothetical protein N7509_000830 [Penicillium cosmopolitanum]|uniref:Fibroin-3 related protein n=1 Tax=Penicillium cosmopolitanum TaxID=1131564 RepID=A0A9W9WBC8_9EURO|nr:uncharacterized protein N7509_000830 [Penicillium cosmopolitanum]KAJ5414203.1 hypothetical protein N7509_000830 [Penicillium cosmopolitanum]
MHLPNMSPVAQPIFARGISDEFKSVNSWDTCMAKSWCKWPVIVGIIVGSVIVIAILACVINCLCCGYQCCKCCCGCCCPSGRRRNKQPKYYDDPPLHQPPPPSANPTYQSSPAPPVYRGATQTQTATFDTPKTANSHVDEDALPAMPTWANAVDKHVEDETHHEDVEMKPLDRKQGAGTPFRPGGSPGGAYSDYTNDNNISAGGYRGFNPTDPYARRSPGPQAVLNPTEPYTRRSPAPPAAFNPADPYARRSPGPQAALNPTDPYARRSPGPQAAYAAATDPYARRSPAPINTFAAAQDPYARRSPALASPVGAPSPYDSQPYQSYDTGNAGYHAVSSPSPVAYNPHTHGANYNAVPTALSPAADPQQQQPAGFTRQPSFGSSQYPPTYTTHQPYRSNTASPAIASSPPPPSYVTSPHEYASHEYGSHDYVAPGTAIGTAVSEPRDNRPPSLLQSGRKPAPNTYRDV